MTDGSTRTESVRGRARALVVLLGLALLLNWAFEGIQLWLTSQSSGGLTSRSIDDLQNILVVEVSVAGLYLVVALAGTVTFGMWVARAHANASALAPGSQRFSRGLAAWCVVIPLANLVLVPMTLADLWRGSEPGRPPGSRGAVGAVRALMVFLVVSFVVFFVGNGIRAGSSGSDVESYFVVQAVLLMIVHAVAIVLWARIVSRITEWQEGRTVEPGVHDGIPSGPRPA